MLSRTKESLGGNGGGNIERLGGEGGGGVEKGGERVLGNRESLCGYLIYCRLCEI